MKSKNSYLHLTLNWGFCSAFWALGLAFHMLKKDLQDGRDKWWEQCKVLITCSKMLCVFRLFYCLLWKWGEAGIQIEVLTLLQESRSEKGWGKKDEVLYRLYCSVTLGGGGGGGIPAEMCLHRFQFWSLISLLLFSVDKTSCSLFWWRATEFLLK